jgi:hypothetical protein
MFGRQHIRPLGFVEILSVCAVVIIHYGLLERWACETDQVMPQAIWWTSSRQITYP